LRHFVFGVYSDVIVGFLYKLEGSGITGASGPDAGDKTD
jgi:hypothetical protein